MTQSFSPTKAQADLINRMRAASATGTIKVQANDDGESAEILIYDVIGFDMWTGEGMTAKRFAEEVKALGNVQQINVRINSPGGDVFDGMTIYNLLVRHSARIVVDVDGLAASIASVIAMAGDQIRMPENSLMMMHDAFGCVCGDEEDMRAVADILEKLDGQIAGIYARRSDLSEEQARKLMDEDAWFTGSEAVEAGLADELTDPVKAAAKFDLSGLKNVPKGVGIEGSARTVQVDVNVDADAIMKDAISASMPSAGSTQPDGPDVDMEAEAVAVRLRQIELDNVLTGA